jgi:hypothetical protein
MVYEHLLGCFILEDPSSGFLELFQIVVVVFGGDIFRSMAIMLGASILLAMAKDICGHCSIAISKVFFRFISHSIVLQLWGLFQEHLSSHQFRVLTFGGCEAIIFGI